MTFAIEFSRRARDNLSRHRKRDQQIILDAIEIQLAHEPTGQTRNRKMLEENPLAPWELRVGVFHVFYDVAPDDRKVIVVAVGEKSGRAHFGSL